MRCTRLLTVTAGIALGLWLAVPGSAAERDAPPAQPDVVVAQNGDSRASESKDSRTERLKKETREAPRYQPPRRGRAWRTIGGATRGSEACRPLIAVLAPDDHSGLTTREQPTLYWYLSDACPSALDFTLIEAEGIAPLVEISLTPPRKAGLQALNLAALGVRLEVGKLYVWSIAFVPDRQHRSRDIVAEGGILRVEPAGDLSARLAGAAEQETPLIYAQAGLWYDALAELSSLIRANPSDHELRRHRASLLDQVHLLAVAGQEVSEAGANPG